MDQCRPFVISALHWLCAIRRDIGVVGYANLTRHSFGWGFVLGWACAWLLVVVWSFVVVHAL